MASEETFTFSKNIFSSILVALIITALPWLVMWYEFSSGNGLSDYGLLPRDIGHWYGIFTMPFLHADVQHLLGNTPPLFILTAFLHYFYRRFFIHVLGFIYVLTGVWTWCIGRPDIHIGASGIVYGLTAYIFFSGAFSKNYRLAAISLLVVFLYGSVVWGLFPAQKSVSWEGHLSGFVAGIIMSVYYRKQQPGRKKYDWETKPDDTEYVKVPVEEMENGIIVTRYIYVPKNKVINLEDYETNGLDGSK